MTGNPTSRGRLHGIALAAGLGLAALALQGVSAAPAGAATGATPVLRTHPMVRTSTAPGTANVGVTDFGWLSTNWSGYIVQGGTGAYTAITGCWTVPSVSPSAEPTFSSTWIGIDGATNADLIQTGTEQEYDGSAAYSAWWEILPAAQTTIPTMTVTPGDAMCAGISEGTGGNWTIAIQDVTTGHQFSTVEQYSGPQTSAEWIIERPEVCDPDCGLATLADYSPITIAPGSVNGANPDLTSADAGTMWNSAQTVQLSTPSNPNANTDGFAMAYGSTQPSPPASPSPTVSSLSPDVGPNAGGVWVTFAGTGIAPGATVTFGSSTSPEVTFTINSQLAALTPPGTGTVAVTITNPNAGSGTAPGAYTYSYDSAVAIRGADAGTWVLEGLDSASPVFAGSWTGQGGLALELPAVVSVPTGSGAGQPLYVVTGMDHNVYVSLPGGAWGALTAAPAYCTDAPAATVVAATPGSTSAYKLVVACRGADGALWWISGPVTAGTRPSGFTGWTSLGGLIATGTSGAPAVTAVQPSSGSISFANELTFFVNGMDGRVWATTAAAGSAGWVTEGWVCSGHLAVGSYVASGTVTSAFACRGADQAVWAATTTGTGWDLQRVGGIEIDGPGIALSPSSWTIVVEGGDHALWQDTSTTTTGSFSFAGWTSAGGVLTNGAQAAALLTQTNNP